MSNRENPALTAYHKAQARFEKSTETKADLVLLALWDETKNQAERIREMALKISVLEMQVGATVESPEYAAAMRQMSWYKPAASAA